MNFGEGLKRIINVPFWLWIILGFFFLINNFNDFWVWLVFGLIVPVVLRLIFFYIIDGFFKK